MITLKIDVKKIDKNRLFVGEKGVYLDAVMIETPNSKYHDYIIMQQVGKEEREAGVKIEIGNGKIMIPKKDNKVSANTIQNPDDLPF